MLGLGTGGRGLKVDGDYIGAALHLSGPGENTWS